VKRLSAAVAWLVVIAFVAVAGLALYVMPRDDRVPPSADVVVVLGGAGPERAELGIELADEHDLDLVLSSSASIFARWQGRACNEDAICFEPSPENTAGEAQNMARMAEERGWEHVVVATSNFHTSRSRMLFRQCLGADRVTVIGRTAADRASDTTPRLMLREATGVVAGLTIARAC
jgi:uncharacterized SAM-binding protein YcdF (DUF218 family)